MMTIRHLEDSSKLRNQGRRLGRAGMSQRVQSLVLDFIENGGGYKQAMILAGQLKAIATAASCDDYWREQVKKGWDKELYAIHSADSVDPDNDRDFETIAALRTEQRRT